MAVAVSSLLPTLPIENISYSLFQRTMLIVPLPSVVLGKIDAHHNTAYMAHHSITLRKRVITVAIQYRLGALGLMATPDGGKNLGLWDQRNALL